MITGGVVLIGANVANYYLDKSYKVSIHTTLDPQELR